MARTNSHLFFQIAGYSLKLFANIVVSFTLVLTFLSIFEAQTLCTLLLIHGGAILFKLGFSIAALIAAGIFIESLR